MEHDYSPLAQAVLDGERDWEQEVIDRHLTGDVVVASGPDGAPLHERKLGYTETLTALKSLTPEHSIYQPTLQVPDAFYERLDLYPS